MGDRIARLKAGLRDAGKDWLAEQRAANRESGQALRDLAAEYPDNFPNLKRRSR